MVLLVTKLTQSIQRNIFLPYVSQLNADQAFFWSSLYSGRAAKMCAFGHLGLPTPFHSLKVQHLSTANASAKILHCLTLNERFTLTPAVNPIILALQRKKIDFVLKFCSCNSELAKIKFRC